MAVYLGDFSEGQTVRFMFSTSGIFGESVNLDDPGTFLIVRDDDGVPAGINAWTLTRDFDGVTGLHLMEIDLGASSVLEPGHGFNIVKTGGQLDGVAFHGALARFSVERDRNELVRELPANDATGSPSINAVGGTDVYVIDDTMPPVSGAFDGALLVVSEGPDRGIARSIVASTWLPPDLTHFEISEPFPASDIDRAYIISDAPPEV